MAYIIMADARMRLIFEKVATHLRKRGHQVDVTVRAQEVLEWMKVQTPDVLVFASPLHDRSGWKLREEIRLYFPALKTQLIWVATMHETDGSPAISWEFADISTFLPFPCSEWQVMLSVEQLLYRTVLSPHENI